MGEQRVVVDAGCFCLRCSNAAPVNSCSPRPRSRGLCSLTNRLSHLFPGDCEEWTKWDMVVFLMVDFSAACEIFKLPHWPTLAPKLLPITFLLR